jgi:hypothetical protein
VSPPVNRAAPPSRDGVALAIVAVVLVVVLAVVALVAGEAAPPAGSDAGPVATGPAARAPGPLIGPTAPTAPITAAPVTSRSPATDPVGDRSPDVPTEVVDPSGPSTPGPLIHPFAQLPGASAEPPRAGPTASLPRQIEADGCDRHYGEVTQCIPLAFPPGVTDRCEWLQARGYGPLAVHGEDRQHLDGDGDGTACALDD